MVVSFYCLSSTLAQINIYNRDIIDIFLSKNIYKKIFPMLKYFC